MGDFGGSVYVANELILIKSSKDYYDRQNVTIKVGNEEIEVPIQILKDFIMKDNVQKSYVQIPE